jgi:type II secretory pathway component PulF
MKAGYNAPQALDIAYSQTKGRLKWILTQVIKDVEHGAYMHEAFEKHAKYFSPLFLNLIKTGELSGSLEENLKHLVLIIQREQEFKHKLRSAMMYPLFVLVAVVGLGLAIGLFVLPNLLPLFGSLDVELPLSTRILMWFAELFDAYGNQIFVGFLVLVVFSFWLFRREFAKPFTHWLVLNTPLIGRLVKQLSMARFGRALASLSRSGMPIDESLKVTATVITNFYYQHVINSSLPLIRKGQTLADALGKNVRFFDDIFIKLLSLGESTAGLEEACDNVADYFESEVDDTMKNLTISLEPMLIIFVGLIVAFVAFSILGPIYKITGSIR